MLGRTHSRITEVEEWINELEDRIRKVTEAEPNRENGI